MLFIVGLGNPGLKYRKTRHNIGFMAIDFLAKENNFPKFKLDKKSKADISKGAINGQEIILVKPQSFMNNSGEVVRKIFNYQFSIFNELSIKQFSKNLVVIHDDFDLPFGEVKIVENSGSGGHHGVQSIIDAIKTQNFKRIKIGIRPKLELPTSQQIKAEDFVLKKFTKNEQSRLGEVMNETILNLNKITL